MERFEKFKEEILERAKAAGACKGEYARALEAESFGSLMEVVRDNFHWAVCKSVIDGAFIDAWREEFAEAKIWHNCDAASGYLLVDNASVKAWGNASVEACDNASVEACDNASVKAWGNASVEAWGNASVKAWGNASVKAWGNASVKAWGNASVEACDNASVEAWSNASVEAWGNAYTTSDYVIECQLNGHAIHRIMNTNTIRYADTDMKFELVKDNGRHE